MALSAAELPTMSSEWYTPPGGGGGGGAGAYEYEEEGASSASSRSGSESDSDSDGSGEYSSDEEEFFEPFDAADTGVERKWRRLSLGRANAPFEDTPAPPPPPPPSAAAADERCELRERARAASSARYYAEAYLDGIPPTHADAAARDADGHYRRWWTERQGGGGDGGEGRGASAGDEAEDRGDEEVGGGGWAHRGDAAVTAAAVPELRPHCLPTVESIFGRASSAPDDGGPRSAGATLRRTLNRELGLDDDDGGGGSLAGASPSPSPTATGSSTPTQASREAAASVVAAVTSESEAEIAAAFAETEAETEAEEDGATALLLRPAPRDQGLGRRGCGRGGEAGGKKRSRGGDGAPPGARDGRVAAGTRSPEPEPLPLRGQELTEQEFQDCLEDEREREEEDGGGGGRPPRPRYVSSDDEGAAGVLGGGGGDDLLSGPYRTPLQVVQSRRISDCKSELLRHLASSGGDVTHPPFLSSLQRLLSLARQSGLDRVDYASESSRALEGMWLTLSRPNYHDCLGLNSNGEYVYTLGRMSFDMFRPTGLACSVQGVFAPCLRVDKRDREEVESVPRSLRQELRDGETVLRTYNIVTALTIEPPSSLPAPASSSPSVDGPNDAVVRPIRGIQTTYGYALPDPRTPNRLSVWFTGGTLEVNDGDEGGTGPDGAEWRRIFTGEETEAASTSSREGNADAEERRPSPPSSRSGGCGGGALPRRQHLGERARVLAARLLLGAAVPERMEDDGTMSYRLRRPIGGHGSTYIDVLFLDDTLRVLRGHHGTVFVFARVPSSSAQAQSL